MLFVICQKWSKQIRYQTGFNFWTSFYRNTKYRPFLHGMKRQVRVLQLMMSERQALLIKERMIVSSMKTNLWEMNEFFMWLVSLHRFRYKGYDDSVLIFPLVIPVYVATDFFLSRNVTLHRVRSVLFAEHCPSNTALVFQIKAAKQSFMMITIILKIVQHS